MARLPRQVVLLGWISLLADVSGEMTAPLLPLYVTGVLGASTIALGLVEGSAEAVVTLMKGTQHPHAAMLFIDFLLSKEAQQVLEKAEYFPAHPEVAPTKSLEPIVPSKAGLKSRFLSEEYMFAARNKSIELQKKYFQSQ